jgi:hypothetical protein
MKITVLILYQVGSWLAKWVPWHHDVARPQVTDVWKGFQMRSVAAAVLNKQTRRARKGVGRWVNTIHRYEMLHRASDLTTKFFWNNGSSSYEKVLGKLCVLLFYAWV